MTFSEISEIYSAPRAERGSKYFQYSEGVYLGNPNNYRNIYLAYNPSGTLFGNSASVPSVQLPNPSDKELNDFRDTRYPNTFGVGSILGEMYGEEVKFGVGMEFLSSRDLPQHDY